MESNYYKHYNFLGKKKRPRRTNQRLKIFVPTEHDSKLLRRWSVFKFYGDIAWYAVCPTCGYNYCCSTHKSDENGVFKNELTHLYRFCPRCGQRFTLKEYIDYTDINIPAIIGFDSLVDIIKAYNQFDSIENEEERKKALEEEYHRQWEECYG